MICIFLGIPNRVDQRNVGESFSVRAMSRMSISMISYTYEYFVKEGVTVYRVTLIY